MAVKRAALRALSVATCSSAGSSSGAVAASAANVARSSRGPLAQSFSARSSGLVRHSVSCQQSPLLQSLMRGSTFGSLPFGARGFASLPPHIKLAMPSLSPTMDQGNILEWKVKEGQELGAGDVIAEIETDKATMDWESQDDGYIAKILVPDGTKDIKVNTTVAIMVEEKKDAGAFANYEASAEIAEEGGGGNSSSSSSSSSAEKKPSSESKPPPESKPSSVGSGSGGSGKSFPPYTPLDMPSQSPEEAKDGKQVVANLVKWNVQVGDGVRAGDSIALIETDKATMDWEIQDDGFIAALLVKDGTEQIPISTTIGVFVEDKESLEAFKGVTVSDLKGGAPSEENEGGGKAEDDCPPAGKQQPQHSEQPKRQQGDRIVASPYARKLAKERGVDISDARPTGTNNRVVAADVEELIKSGGKQKSDASAGTQQTLGKKGGSSKGQQGGGAEVPSRREGGFTDTPNSNIRRITAARLLESKQSIPHYYVTAAVRVDKMMALRKQINEALASDGTKLSVNDFIVKASALALRDVPEVNSAWMGNFIRQYDSVHVSVAVQTPSGLMVPVIRDTDTLGLSDINAQVKALAAKAKDNKLTAEQMTGGTFTISNLGMFGVDQFCAIINPPQVCILAVGGAVERVVTAPGGGFEAASFINATLSCDHRVVDGALGAQWLQAFKKRIESPLEMLI